VASRCPALPAERSTTQAARERGDGPSAVALRPLRKADLDTVGALQEASILALGAAVYSRAQLDAWARFGWHYRHKLLDDGAFFVAERPDRLIGVGGWSPDSLATELAWLRYLFVHPDAAGRGVGRRLVEAIEADARGSGKASFRVWSSLNAAGFYAALGYLRVRRGRWPVTGAIEIDYLLFAKEA
jgi:GNAT superfamily N-acetyltransferase